MFPLLESRHFTEIKDHARVHAWSHNLRLFYLHVKTDCTIPKRKQTGYINFVCFKEEENYTWLVDCLKLFILIKIICMSVKFEKHSNHQVSRNNFAIL